MVSEWFGAGCIEGAWLVNSSGTGCIEGAWLVNGLGAVCIGGVWLVNGLGAGCIGGAWLGNGSGTGCIGGACWVYEALTNHAPPIPPVMLHQYYKTKCETSGKDYLG